MGALFRPFKLAELCLRERWNKGHLERQLKPPALSGARARAQVLDECGAEGGCLLPIYHFNAELISQLLPRGGVLLDLGCGSGRMLAYLSKRRPDIRVIGLESAKSMIELSLAVAGTPKFQVLEGRLADAHRQVMERVDLVSCMFGAHRFTSAESLAKFLASLRILKFRNNCSVLIFDYARPSHPKSADTFARNFLLNAPALMVAETAASLKAAFAFNELAGALDDLGIGPFEHYHASPLPFFQIHRLRSEKHYEITNTFWRESHLGGIKSSNYRLLRSLFPKRALM